MATALTTAPKHGHPTFLFSELATDLDALQADIAFLGIPYGSAYSVGEISNDQSTMPTAVRQASDRRCAASSATTSTSAARSTTASRSAPWTAATCAPSYDHKAHWRAPSRRCARSSPPGRCRSCSAATTPYRSPCCAPTRAAGPITLVQIDAHLDWRDEVNGVRDGSRARSAAPRR